MCEEVLLWMAQLNLLQELPASVDESGCLSVSDSSVTSGESDALSIAWRYQNQPKYQVKILLNG